MIESWILPVEQEETPIQVTAKMRRGEALLLSIVTSVASTLSAGRLFHSSIDRILMKTMYDIALIARCISPAGSMIAVNRKNLHTLFRYDRFIRSWAFLPCHRRLIARLRLFGLPLTIVVVVETVLGCIYYIAAIGWDNWDIIFIFMQIFIFMRSLTQIRVQFSLDFE